MRSDGDFVHFFDSDATIDEILLFSSKSPVIYLRPTEYINDKLPKKPEAMEVCDECGKQVFKFQLKEHKDGHFVVRRD